MLLVQGTEYLPGSGGVGGSSGAATRHGSGVLSYGNLSKRWEGVATSPSDAGHHLTERP